MTVNGKEKESLMNNTVFTLSMLFAFLGLVLSVLFYNYTEIKSLERNVESAIVKGIDPLAVRCSYSKQHDNICIAYAVSNSRNTSISMPDASKKTK